MKQQGETTSTVERIRGLQTDIQELRSQNDSLKAEVEAQQAAHKAQIGAAEIRAHESWLTARQAQRRFEESVAEAGALRRKLTALSAGADVSGKYHLGLDDRAGRCTKVGAHFRLFEQRTRPWTVPTIRLQPAPPPST